jgi:beta-glucosidase
MTKGMSPGESLAFPTGFTWGAATAAYQIEGATDADGRGLSVWDTFSRMPGKVRGGDTGDIACDSYHRYPEDADLLRSLGLSAYRFSVSWPRVFPSGAGQLNQAGLDYYKRLLDALGERGITAAATLFHWDLPQALQDRGGWAARDTAYRFADYASVVAEALGDRVTRWITLNEPLVVAHNGHRIGVHAPGLTDNAVAAAVTHHLLLGHGLGAAAVRAAVPGAQVGITLNLTPVRIAASASVNGSAEALERARLVADATHNGVFLEPVLSGRYPEHAPAAILPPADLILDGDMETIAAPIDFLGVNYYMPHFVDAAGLDISPEGMPVTAMDWLVHPDGLYDLLIRLRDEAPGLPLYITENGAAYHDYVTPEGTVDDYERIDYLDGHLRAAARAIADGAGLRGYFAWSLMDNFEWGMGYSQRFGLVFTDLGTQRRIIKRSGHWYADVIRRGGLP